MCSLWRLRPGSRVALHLRSPLQETPEIAALSPDEGPELDEVDLLHFDATVGFHAPQQIRAAPRRQPVAASCVPEKAQQIAHEVSLQYSRKRRESGQARSSCSAVANSEVQQRGASFSLR